MALPLHFFPFSWSSVDDDDGITIAAPLAQDLRVWTLVDLTAYGYPDDDDGNERLQRLILQIVSWLEHKSHRKLTEIPDEMAPFAQMLIEQLVVWNVFRKQPDAIESRNDFDLIQQYQAGDYNETRRGLQSGAYVLHTDPDINKLLTQYMNPSENAGITPAVSRPYEPNWDTASDMMRHSYPRSTGPWW